jgi:ElaA protein
LALKNQHLLLPWGRFYLKAASSGLKAKERKKGNDMRWQWVAWEALSKEDLYDMMMLRQEVFVVEQDCPYMDADGRDPEAMHLLGWKEKTLVAYVRAFAPGVVYEEASIGRVVTSPSIRGTGQGRPLMREAIRCSVQTWGSAPIKISAQSHLETYYGSLGFEVCGDGYLEDGIPHLPMRLSH